MATKSKKQNGNGVTWAGELGRKYTSGISHMFILHFNVEDYTSGLTTVEEYLGRMLEARDLVITYDLAGGLRFRSDKERKLFITMTGLDQATAVSSLAEQMGLGQPVESQAAEIELPRAPVKALPLLEQAMKVQQVEVDGQFIYPRTAVIVRWPELMSPACDVAMMQPADRVAMATLAGWATDPEIRANQAIVILITRNLTELAEPLRRSTSQIEAITIPLPDGAARLAWIEQYLEYRSSERATEIESNAWDAVREAMAHQPELESGWYWDEACTFPWTEDDLNSAPSAELRREAKTLLVKARREAGKAIPKLELAIPVEIFARMTAGLSLLHVEDICLRSMHERRPVDRELVKERKDEIIMQEYGDVLEVMDPQWGLDMVAGHKLVKAYFQDYVIQALHKGDVARAPQGVLLVGPPGTGKTAIVEAVAFEAGFNAVNLNLARILGGLVGASERNLEKALLAIEALTPCVVFTDEIDQKLGRRSEGFQGDSGVSARLFARVMEFMSDTSHRGRIVWLAASNRPDLLDAAFKRPGRFDAIIPMLLPDDETDRLELFEVMLRKYGLKLADDSLKSVDAKMQKAASQTAGYTGAEIEAVTIKANQIAGRHGRKEGIVHPDDVLEALKYIPPSTAGIEYMTLLALDTVTDLEFVPERYRQQAGNKQGLQSDIEKHTPPTHRSARREL